VDPPLKERIRGSAAPSTTGGRGWATPCQVKAQGCPLGTIDEAPGELGGFSFLAKFFFFFFFFWITFNFYFFIFLFFLFFLFYFFFLLFYWVSRKAPGEPLPVSLTLTLFW
jgi:hypothetical protein